MNLIQIKSIINFNSDPSVFNLIQTPLLIWKKSISLCLTHIKTLECMFNYLRIISVFHLLPPPSALELTDNFTKYLNYICVSTRFISNKAPFCHNKTQTGQLEKQKFIFPLFWRPEVQDQDTSMVGFQSSLPGLQKDPFSPAVFHMAFPQ